MPSRDGGFRLERTEPASSGPPVAELPHGVGQHAAGGADGEQDHRAEEHRRVELRQDADRALRTRDVHGVEGDRDAGEQHEPRGTDDEEPVQAPEPVPVPEPTEHGDGGPGDDDGDVRHLDCGVQRGRQLVPVGHHELRRRGRRVDQAEQHDEGDEHQDAADDPTGAEELGGACSGLDRLREGEHAAHHQAATDQVGDVRHVRHTGEERRHVGLVDRESDGDAAAADHQPGDAGRLCAHQEEPDDQHRQDQPDRDRSPDVQRHRVTGRSRAGPRGRAVRSAARAGRRRARRSVRAGCPASG